MSATLRFILKFATLFIFLMLFFIGNFYTYSQSTTPFKEVAKNSPPRYYTIKRVLQNRDLKLRNYYNNYQWGKGGNIGEAWSKSMSYFPKKFYYSSETKFFMMHQFTGGGLARITVFESTEIKKATENFHNFSDKGIVKYYNKIKNNADALKEFKEKLGLLESYFENEKAKRLLKRYLESKLYNELLKSLREEGDHIFAAALLHEGMHASLGSAVKASKIDKDFKSCKAPVQWDELRGYMSEMQYHFNYYKFSQDKINAHMKAINNLLKSLEKFWGLKKPLKKSQLKAIEKLKAKIKAHIAMIRVSLREMQQSLDRMKSMLDFFKKQNYVKPGAPKKYHDMVKNLETKLENFSKEVKKTIAAYEKGLKGLEDMLKAWNEWAKCRKTDPPTEEEHKKSKKEFEDVSWPSAPSTDEEKDISERKLAITYNLGPYADTGGDGNGDGDKEKEIIKEISDKYDSSDRKGDIVISGGAEFSKPKMDNINSYFDYLNTTWNGNIDAVDQSTGFWISGMYHSGTNFAFGLDFTHHSLSASGALQVPGSSYTSDLSFSSIAVTINYDIPISSSFLMTISGGLGPQWSDYKEIENTFEVSGSSSIIGFQTSFNLTYYFSPSFGATAGFGYRAAKFDDYGVEFFQPSNSNVQLDFSGSFSRIGIKIRL